MAKSVRQHFELNLRRELPQFQRLRGLPLPAECRAYEWRVAGQLHYHLLLQLHRSEDAFTVEVGWTTNGRWPEHVPLPDGPHETAVSGDMRFRIGFLWSSRSDHWWRLAPCRVVRLGAEDDGDDLGARLARLRYPPPLADALAQVPRQVDDAIARIRQYALPYFGRVASALGMDIGVA